jgi:cob(I)alamin adenosyltransferase
MERVDLPPKFVIPGGTEISARREQARTAMRRAERRTVDLDVRTELLTYLNRASDAVYAIARYTDEPDPQLFGGRS